MYRTQRLMAIWLRREWGKLWKFKNAVFPTSMPLRDILDIRRYRGAAETPKPIVAQLIAIMIPFIQMHKPIHVKLFKVAPLCLLSVYQKYSQRLYCNSRWRACRKTAFLNFSQLTPLIAKPYGYPSKTFIHQIKPTSSDFQHMKYETDLSTYGWDKWGLEIAVVFRPPCIWCLLQFLGKIQFWNLNGSLSPYQCILVEVTIRSIHGLHHEFVTILLVRVELEGLQTHWNAWLWKLTVMILWWWYRADKLIVVRKLPEIWTVCLGSIKPEFGLTQYRFGAVVLILKQTLRSDGFVRRIEDETWLVKGPERWFKKPKYAW